MFDSMKEAIAQLGKLAAERPSNLGAGYIADRPDLLRHCIRCWSPCGCCVTYMSQSASVLTQCTREDEKHDFSWEEAERCIQAFISAEERGKLSVVEPVVEPVVESIEEEKSSAGNKPSIAVAEPSPEDSSESPASPGREDLAPK